MSLGLAALWLWAAAAQVEPGPGPEPGPPEVEAEPPPVPPAEAPAPAWLEPEPIWATDGPPVPAEGPREPTVRLFGEASGSLAVDTWFDSPRGDPLAENVADLRFRARTGADVSLSDSLRLLLEGRVRWRGTTQRAFDRTKATFEAELGEAFLDLYAPRLDVRLGQQVFALGANAVGAPTDVLNPRDLREGPLAGLELNKLPVFGARVSGELGPVRWLVGYVPFFQPHRYALFGQDEALLQPAAGQVLPLELHESIEDQLQPHLLETERPKAFPWQGDLALQLRADVGPTRVGASWAFVHEKLPQVEVDPELAELMRQLGADGPVDPATALSVRNRLRAGERLLHGVYPRQHVVGLDATLLVGPAQLDVDLGWSPRQTFTTHALQSLRRTTFSWTVALTPAEDSELSYAVSWSALAVRKVPADDRLFLLEPATARGRERTAWFHLFAGELGHRFLDRKLHATLRLAFEPVVGSFLLQPRLRYDLEDRYRVLLWAELWQGKSRSVFGYYARNDQVAVAVEADLF